MQEKKTYRKAFRNLIVSLKAKENRKLVRNMIIFFTITMTLLLAWAIGGVDLIKSPKIKKSATHSKK